MMQRCPQTGLMRDLDAENHAYEARWAAIYPRQTAREAEIDRLCARLELESDEFLTREQKAEAYLRGNSHAK